jgi:pimeloyl-ACP methyl ester carboxylesterase
MQSKHVMVDSIRTHYLEAGEGPVVVLLHSGEFGGCSEMSWEYNIPALAKHFRVLAPDFVGFGKTDKVRDFTSHGARMIQHITRYLEVMCVDQADFIGNSVAGRFLCRIASARPVVWPMRRMVCASGAGVEPDNQQRRNLQNYDGTKESMCLVLQALFHNQKWWTDERYLTRRHELSLIPGAWEVAAAARLKAPWTPERQAYGRPDRTPYDQIAIPALFIAGANDPLIEPGWERIAATTKNGTSAVFQECGHCPNIECADQFNETVIAFLTKDDMGKNAQAEG